MALETRSHVSVHDHSSGKKSAHQEIIISQFPESTFMTVGDLLDFADVIRQTNISLDQRIYMIHVGLLHLHGGSGTLAGLKVIEKRNIASPDQEVLI